MHRDEMKALTREQCELHAKHLDGESDFLVVVLKSHLLIEEGLDDCLRAFVGPEIAGDVSLRFYAKTRIVEGLLRGRDRCGYSEEQFSSCFDFILKLNSVRNTLAHSLDSPALANKEASLLLATSKSINSFHPDHPIDLDRHRDEPYVDVKTACLMTCFLLVLLKPNARY